MPEPAVSTLPTPKMTPMQDRAILGTAVVPWTDRFEFDEAAFDQQVAAIARGLTPYLYVFGTAGEGYAVSEAQFRQIATAFWKSSLRHSAQPMLGVISLSLGTVIERIEFGRALGYREFQLSLPSWGALNDTELDRFFAESCGRFPDCRFLHYNLSRAGRILGATEYRRLVAAHPNLVAVKTGIQDPVKVRELMDLSPRLRFFFTEFGYAEARTVGDCGLLISLSSVSDRRGLEFVSCDDARRREMIVQLREMLATLLRLGSGRYHMDGAFDKLLYRMKAPDFPLRLLPPYAGPTEADAAALRASLGEAWRSP
ncbi:MAG: Dihydrodipicolinate synthase/N-acetylneuraminate lyase [Verrucomicrobia bacterium]|nr:Dihydrodipicolinate synthase/N-acetylneuraminate lyase [Verrucomicrobiota bacterium]